MAVKINILCLDDNKIHYVVFFSLQSEKYLISEKKRKFKNYNNFKRKQNNDERRKNSR